MHAEVLAAGRMEIVDKHADVVGDEADIRDDVEELSRRIDEVRRRIRHIRIQADRIDHAQRIAAGEAADAGVVVARAVVHQPRRVGLAAGVAVLRDGACAAHAHPPRIEALVRSKPAGAAGQADDRAQPVLQVRVLRGCGQVRLARQAQDRLVHSCAVDVDRGRAAAGAAGPLGVDLVAIVEIARRRRAGGLGDAAAFVVVLVALGDGVGAAARGAGELVERIPHQRQRRGPRAAGGAVAGAARDARALAELRHAPGGVVHGRTDQGAAVAARADLGELMRSVVQVRRGLAGAGQAAAVAPEVIAVGLAGRAVGGRGQAVEVVVRKAPVARGPGNRLGVRGPAALRIEPVDVAGEHAGAEQVVPRPEAAVLEPALRGAQPRVQALLDEPPASVPGEGDVLAVGRGNAGQAAHRVVGEAGGMTGAVFDPGQASARRPGVGQGLVAPAVAHARQPLRGVPGVVAGHHELARAVARLGARDQAQRVAAVDHALARAAGHSGHHSLAQQPLHLAGLAARAPGVAGALRGCGLHWRLAAHPLAVAVPAPAPGAPERVGLGQQPAPVVVHAAHLAPDGRVGQVAGAAGGVGGRAGPDLAHLAQGRVDQAGDRAAAVAGAGLRADAAGQAAEFVVEAVAVAPRAVGGNMLDAQRPPGAVPGHDLARAALGLAADPGQGGAAQPPVLRLAMVLEAGGQPVGVGHRAHPPEHVEVEGHTLALLVEDAADAPERVALEADAVAIGPGKLEQVAQRVAPLQRRVAGVADAALEAVEPVPDRVVPVDERPAHRQPDEDGVAVGVKDGVPQVAAAVGAADRAVEDAGTGAQGFLAKMPPSLAIRPSGSGGQGGTACGHSGGQTIGGSLSNWACSSASARHRAMQSGRSRRDSSSWKRAWSASSKSRGGSSVE